MLDAEKSMDLAGLFEAAPDAILVVDREGRIVRINAQAEKLFGYTRAELVGANHDTLVPDRLRATHIASRDVYLEAPDVRSMGMLAPVLARRKDGSEVAVEINLSPLQGADEGLIVSFVRDATERHRTEHALRMGEDRLRRMQLVTSALAEALSPFEVGQVLVHQGAAATGATTVSVYMLEDTALSLLAITALHGEQGLAEKWKTIPLSLDTPLAYSAREGVPLFLASPAEWMAWAERFPGGPSPSPESVAWATIPLIVKGRTIGVVGLAFSSPTSVGVSDVELVARMAEQCAQAFDRARLHEADQRSARRRALLARADAQVAESLDWATISRVVDVVVPELAHYCALATYEGTHLRGVAVAPRAAGRADMLEELLRTWRFAPNDPTPFTRMWSALQSLRMPDYSVHAHTSKLTSARVELIEQLAPRSLLLVPVSFRGELYGTLTLLNTTRNFDAEDEAIAEELARRVGVALENAHLYEEAVAEREAAERAKSMRDDVLSIVAHDLGSPINAIGLWADVVFRGAPHDASGESTRETAAKIKDAVRWVNTLLRDLLDAASIEAGHLAIVPGETTAADLAREAISRFAPLAAEQGIGLAISAPTEAAHVRVTCDANRIQQVLGNLLGNALKFTRRGGNVVVGVEPGDREVRFSVADSGPGIAPDAAANIFERFWRGDERDRAKGVGLGLYIAKGIIDAHGGKLWVTSTLGDGATFHFTLPLAREPVGDGTTSALITHEPTSSRTKDEP